MEKNKNIKLIVQIPCLNEEKTLPITLNTISRCIDGVAKVEVLVVDDGSKDKTKEIADKLGVDHIERLSKTHGLANAFKVGLNSCLKNGADIIVNMDADNQYRGEDIPRLIKPILEGRADIVIGNRRINRIRSFSLFKKILQYFGSWVVRHLSGTRIQDVTTGFRAYSREAALRINVLSDYTYTLETIIQAGKESVVIENIEVDTNKSLRKSRLFKNIFEYLLKSVITIIRVYSMFNPLKVFFTIGAITFSFGVFIGVRFLYFYFTGGGSGHIQSLILVAIFLIFGFQIILIGLLADLIASNRKLIEDVLYRLKKEAL
ncbi:MAG: glycosyltransferase family 2 protein [Candidatus Gygaella obscura]|nr:glycosyltransferase family 2 protein [Candidatus Gygaella obscura]